MRNRDGYGVVVRLVHASPLLFVLAGAAGADPGTATPGAAPAPSATRSRGSEGPKEVQSTQPAETKPRAKMTPPEIQRISDEYFKQCMQDWDRATHMTKKEWERTCRRVVDGRVKFMIEQMGK
jgi:hypothetical protein